MIKLGLVDDHSLIRSAFKTMLDARGFQVVLEMGSSQEFMKHKEVKSLDVVLVDINMPGTNGIELSNWIRENHVSVKVIAVSALTDEFNVIKMLKSGARAYIPKSSSDRELIDSIHSVFKHGYYYSDLVSGTLIKTLNDNDLEYETQIALQLTSKEITFLRYLCNEMTNKQIANSMFVSARTVETWRQKLCEKINVKGGIGLAQFAIRNNII